MTDSTNNRISNPAVDVLMTAMAYEKEESKDCGYFSDPVKFYIRLSGYNSSIKTGELRFTEQDVLDWAKAIEEKRKQSVTWADDPALWVSIQPSVLTTVEECSQSRTGSETATKIAVIKEVRQLRPELDLREAKETVENAFARGLLEF